MSDDIAALLREIRDNQREALQVQREHVRLYTEQLGRVERINDRAEAIQARAGRSVRLVLGVAVPLLVLLILFMLWPYARYYLFLLAHR
ncbi:MAG TPA: hypothetical protein VLM17_00145 [Xanthomonadaceae bacterium]|nr:hypothetical protein [Xanthomonadaceae bacterium]